MLYADTFISGGLVYMYGLAIACLTVSNFGCFLYVCLPYDEGHCFCMLTYVTWAFLGEVTWAFLGEVTVW